MIRKKKIKIVDSHPTKRAKMKRDKINLRHKTTLQFRSAERIADTSNILKKGIKSKENRPQTNKERVSGKPKLL